MHGCANIRRLINNGQNTHACKYTTGGQTLTGSRPSLITVESCVLFQNCIKPLEKQEWGPHMLRVGSIPPDKVLGDHGSESAMEHIEIIEMCPIRYTITRRYYDMGCSWMHISSWS